MAAISGKRSSPSGNLEEGGVRSLLSEGEGVGSSGFGRVVRPSPRKAIPKGLDQTWIKTECELVRKLIAEGPRFIWRGGGARIPHPRKEGEMRRVCRLQVATASRVGIASEIFDQLEYREVCNGETWERKLDTELQAALEHQRKQQDDPLFSEISLMFLERNDEIDRRESGSFVVKEIAEKGTPETRISFMPLREEIRGGLAWTQGKRFSMEDAHSSKVFSFVSNEEKILVKLTGVFDGHSGSFCSELLAEHFARYLRVRLEQYNSEKVSLEGICNSIKLAPVDFCRSYLGEGGCCANFLLEIPEWGVFCGNIGDTRAFLMTRGGRVFQLSEDQKIPFRGGSEEEKHLYSPRYERGIQHRGLWIMDGRVCGLNIARVIGDMGGSVRNQQMLSARPKITLLTKGRVEQLLGRPIAEGERFFLFHGCDGLFDVGSTRQYAGIIADQLAEGHSFPRVAAATVEAAFLANSTDNLTAMIREIQF